MPTRTQWNGDIIVAHVEKELVAATNETLEATAEDMRTNHWWRAHRNGGRSGLEGQVRVQAARVVGDRIIGSVGATYSGQKGRFSGFYGLFLERRIPWIRPAADRNFPTFLARARRRLAK